MSRFKKLTAMLALLVLIAFQTGWAQMHTQTFSRMFSYDPHPTSVDFSEPVIFNGESLKHRVVFHETWKSVKDKDFLQTINFTIQAMKGSEVVSSASTAPFTVSKLTKGQKAGETKLGETVLTVTIDEFVKSGSGITDLTLTFKIENPQSTAGQAVEKPVEKLAEKGDEIVKTSIPAGTKTSAALYFCQKLAERAAEMPAENVVARLSLLKKALAAAPLAESSPDAADFRARIGKQISELEGNQTSSPKASSPEDKVAPTPVSTGASAPEPNSPPAGKPDATAATAAKSAVDPSAQQLYLSAKTLFAQDKGPEGREALRKALEIAPDYIDALVLQGENAYSNRKYARAREAFEKAINLNEKNADVLLKYFKACYYMGEGMEGMLRLTAVKDKFPNDTSFKFSACEAYFQLGDLINAEAVCNEILNISPESSRAKDLMQRIKSHLK